MDGTLSPLWLAALCFLLAARPIPGSREHEVDLDQVIIVSCTFLGAPYHLPRFPVMPNARVNNAMFKNCYRRLMALATDMRHPHIEDFVVIARNCGADCTVDDYLELVKLFGGTDVWQESTLTLLLDNTIINGWPIVETVSKVVLHDTPTFWQLNTQRGLFPLTKHITQNVFDQIDAIRSVPPYYMGRVFYFYRQWVRTTKDRCLVPMVTSLGVFFKEMEVGRGIAFDYKAEHKFMFDALCCETCEWKLPAVLSVFTTYVPDPKVPLAFIKVLLLVAGKQLSLFDQPDIMTVYNGSPVNRDEFLVYIAQACVPKPLEYRTCIKAIVDGLSNKYRPPTLQPDMAANGIGTAIGDGTANIVANVIKPLTPKIAGNPRLRRLFITSTDPPKKEREVASAPRVDDKRPEAMATMLGSGADKSQAAAHPQRFSFGDDPATKPPSAAASHPNNPFQPEHGERKEPPVERKESPFSRMASSKPDDEQPKYPDLSKSKPAFDRLSKQQYQPEAPGGAGKDLPHLEVSAKPHAFDEGLYTALYASNRLPASESYRAEAASARDQNQRSVTASPKTGEDEPGTGYRNPAFNHQNAFQRQPTERQDQAATSLRSPADNGGHI